jgi:hypothetical protein
MNESESSKGLQKVKDDWKKIEEKFKPLKEKMRQDIIKNIEKIENLHYQNIQNMDAMKEKIESDWHAFEEEMHGNFQNIKNANKENKETFIQNVNAKKQEVNEKLAKWEDNYKEWSKKTKKDIQKSATALNRWAWKTYLQCLLAVIPIVIIVVVLVLAFK